MKRSKTPASQCLRVLAGCVSILLIVACIQGCAKKQPPAPQKQGKPEPNTAAKAAVQTSKPATDAVLVTVDGSPIKESQLDKRIMKELMSTYGGKVAPQMIDQAKKMMRVQAIDVMVSEMLLDQQIKAAGMKTTDQDVITAVNAEGATMTPPMTFDQYKKAILGRGDDFNDIMADLRVNLSRQKFIEFQLAGKADVNEAQAKAYYDANPKNFQQPEQVRASHILISPGILDPNADPNQAKIAAKQKAQKLLAQIKAGADFAELAKSSSQDPGSAPKGGDLDFFLRGEMEKPFEDAAFALEPNKVSDVVETRFGYHIIKVTERKPAGTMPFEDVKKAIIAKLSDPKRAEVLNDYLGSLRAKAKIIYTSPSDAPAIQPVSEGAPAPTPAAPKPAADANQK